MKNSDSDYKAEDEGIKIFYSKDQQVIVQQKKSFLKRFHFL